MKNYVVLDLETTGLSPENDRIIEIAAVRFNTGETFSCLVDPECMVSERITELTGISQEMLYGAASIGEALEKLDTFLGPDPVIIGHNIGFDYAFLKVNFSREQKKAKSSPFPNWGAGELAGIDTLAMAKKLHPDFLHKNLATMVAYYGIINENAHRALSDTIATARLYEVMCEECKMKGDESLLSILEPVKLTCREKKQTPISEKQKKYLLDLIRFHQIPLSFLLERLESKAALSEADWEEVKRERNSWRDSVQSGEKGEDAVIPGTFSQSRASRVIDGIILHFGKIRRY